MLAPIIKLRYGYTIDTNNSEDELCPYCGGVICHVLEDSHKVFCTSAFCSFQDETKEDDFDDYIINRFKYLLSYSSVFLRRFDQQYSNYNHPFIMEEDWKQNKYIVRNFVLDSQKYANYSRKGATKEMCYKKDSPIIAKYASLKLLVRDGWRVEERPDLD